MPVSTLDTRTALIVVDLQSGTVRNPTVHPIEGVIANAASLLSAFRAQSLPVVIATVDGTAAGRAEYGRGASAWPAEMTTLVPEVVVESDDITVTRRAWSVFSVRMPSPACSKRESPRSSSWVSQRASASSRPPVTRTMPGST